MGQRSEVFKKMIWTGRREEEEESRKRRERSGRASERRARKQEPLRGALGPMRLARRQQINIRFSCLCLSLHSRLLYIIYVYHLRLNSYSTIDQGHILYSLFCVLRVEYVLCAHCPVLVQTEKNKPR